jgi:hypothetical protein
MATFNGTAGNDSLPGLLEILTGLDDDEINGLGGGDIATCQSSNAGVTINLGAVSAVELDLGPIKIALDSVSIGSAGHAEGGQLTGITNLTGNAFGQQQTVGSRGDNHIDCGSDTLSGGSGAGTFAFSTALGAATRTRSPTSACRSIRSSLRMRSSRSPDQRQSPSASRPANSSEGGPARLA